MFLFSLLLHVIVFLCNIGPYCLQSLTKFQQRGGKTFSRLSWIFTALRSFQQKFYRMRLRWISGRLLKYCEIGIHMYIIVHVVLISIYVHNQRIFCKHKNKCITGINLPVECKLYEWIEGVQFYKEYTSIILQLLQYTCRKNLKRKKTLKFNMK